MITTKQRAYLRGLANKCEVVLQIGKGGITDQTVKQLNDVLEARELVKIQCLETSFISPRQAAQNLAEICKTEIVQVIGTKFILYRPSRKNPQITLPKQTRNKTEQN